MKLLLAMVIILSSISSNSQTIKEYLKDDYLKKTGAKAALMFAAGACDGQVEVLSHHYGDFKKVFPNANDQFWNPKISWTNKYEDNDPNKGSAYFGSKNILVCTTDGYHAFKMGQKACIFTAVTIEIGGCRKHKKKFKHYLVDLIWYSGCYTAGFYTTYRVIYN